MTTAIFGGSFDPPHVAHLMLASYVLAVTDFDRVLVVPTFEHPFERKAPTPFEERLELCRRCFAGLPRVEVSGVEANLPRPSYTVRLLEHLRSERPEEPLRLVIGSDVLNETDQWHDFERVRELAPPFVIARRGHERLSLGPAVLPEISSTRVRELLYFRDEQAAARELEWVVPLAVRARITERGLYPRRATLPPPSVP